MRTLLIPLVLALAGYVLLVYWTFPRTDAVEGPEAVADEGALALFEGRVTGRADEGDAVGTLEGVVVQEAREVPFGAAVDATGTFAVQPDPELPRGDVELRLWTRDARGSVTRFANLVTTLTDGASADLGDVPLGSLPPLVGGTVVDASGVPVARCAVHVLAATHRGASQELVYAPVPAPHPIDGFTDDAGRFALFGLPKAHGLALQVSATELAGGGTAPRLFAPGAAGVEIVLGDPGTLALETTLASQDVAIDLGFASVWAHAWPAGAPRTEELRLLVPLAEADARGVVRFEDLWPGVYDVTVHLADPSSPSIGGVDGVGLGGGATVSTPFVRRDLEHFRIRVLNAADEELEARFAYRLPGQTTWIPATPVSADPEHPGVVSAWPVLDLQVSAAGYEPTVLANVDGDRAVVLQARD